MKKSKFGFRAQAQYAWLPIVAVGTMLGCSPSHQEAPDAMDPFGKGDHGGSTGHVDGGAGHVDGGPADAHGDASGGAIASCGVDAAAGTGGGGTGGTGGGGTGGTGGGGTGGTAGAPDGGAPDGGGGAPACMNDDCDVGDSECSPTSGSVVDLCILGVDGCTHIVPSQCPGSAVCQRTSIAQCSGQELAEWPISNGASDVAAGAPNLETFVDNLDGTVTDKVTGLMWEQEFHLAMFPVDICATDANAGGFRDWRMPTIIELISIADFTRDNPSIDTKFFPLSPDAGPFWSSTYRQGFGSSLDIIDYSVPYIDNAGGFGVPGVPGQNIRCVR